MHTQVLAVTTLSGLALAALAGAFTLVVTTWAAALGLVWATRAVVRRRWAPSLGWDHRTALAVLALSCLPVALVHGYVLARPGGVQGLFRLVAAQALLGRV